MSEFRDDDLYGIEGPNTGRIQDKLRDPARLKNWWDQYALEAADRLDWLERELAAVTRDVTRERDEARAEVERRRKVLAVAEAALGECQPCAEPECRTIQKDYIDTALKAIDAARKEQA